MKRQAEKLVPLSTNICRNFSNQTSFAPDMNPLAVDPARAIPEVL
jgi:hypothetical protein